MLIDIIVAVVLILGLFRGYSRGLIVGIFSFISVIIGLAAALKLSAVVAGYIGKSVKVSEEWLPLISFAVVFLAVVLLIRLGAKAIEKSFELAMLGWVNKLGGMIFFAVIYLLVLSVLFFYGEQMKLISPEAIAQSKTWSYIAPWGPRIINGVGAVIPVFKDMFTDLQEFFGRVAGQP
jgi:membrane protein required for colicin V production